MRRVDRQHSRTRGVTAALGRDRRPGPARPTAISRRSIFDGSAVQTHRWIGRSTGFDRVYRHRPAQAHDDRGPRCAVVREHATRAQWDHGGGIL